MANDNMKEIYRHYNLVMRLRSKGLPVCDEAANVIEELHDSHEWNKRMGSVNRQLMELLLESQETVKALKAEKATG